MEDVLLGIAMAAVTLPISFYIARGCLRGLIRIVSFRRHVL